MNKNTRRYTTLLSFLLLCIFVNAQEFLEINGNRVQVEKKGTGLPVLVCVAGYGGSLASFDSVFNKLSSFTTVIRYSRAGLGKSSYTNKNKDFDTIVHELETLVRTLDIQQPFVLLGHSYGGLMIRSYAKRHPEQIAGLIFDDATFEDYFNILAPLKANAKKLELEEHDKVMKKYPVPAMDDEFRSLWKVWHSPLAWKKWFDPMPAVPVLVLTSMKIADSALRSGPALMQARYAAHSRWLKDKPFSMQIGITTGGHFLHRDNPALFVESVQVLISAIREKN